MREAGFNSIYQALQDCAQGSWKDQQVLHKWYGGFSPITEHMVGNDLDKTGQGL